MLNVLHGRFAANPAQNRPSHIMKGKKAQMSTVSHWDWIRHPHLSLLIHKRPRSPFLSALSSVPLMHTHQTLRWSRWVTSAQTSTLKPTSVGLWNPSVQSFSTLPPSFFTFATGLQRLHGGWPHCIFRVVWRHHVHPTESCGCMRWAVLTVFVQISHEMSNTGKQRWTWNTGTNQNTGPGIRILISD